MKLSSQPTSILQRLSISITWVWLLLFALLPLCIMLFLSFLQHDEQNLFILKGTLANYRQLIDPLFFKIILSSMQQAFIVTVLCLLIAYPTAFFIARCQSQYKNILLLLMVIPFWTSSIIRIYAMLALLKTKGLLNSLLLTLGLIHQPLQLIYTDTAVLIGLVYNLIPFMLLPLYSNIERLDNCLFEAARDLGASRWKVFKDILLPLTMPGIVGGILLVFLPAMSLFYIPDVLGGAKSILLGNLIESQFLMIHNWPGGSATSIVLTAMMIILILIYKKVYPSGKASDLI
ncbi:MAG: spermidine/putrescine ABC transporter permease [Gammaproteobacteria bacterium RIFCSPHIGHO2_12_FULL_41_15]|nr:MAG: spermidine/putrescine ABC transporter permease [Gammaproteobacteria bacterium RIFCSPHIGHO2_12_FULL_41_15]